ncbi:MAG: O-acetyl-ADP-ribose deacetylase [Deltaproteobacteria bacterium]|nr:O-acetyl-ADP-ribose deacetylase [Deltaproteobacteria bacterium]
MKNIKDKIEILLGDITQLNTDAIVNAANKTLLGGGGVDGAIHRAAGPMLREECKMLGGCETGEAKITKGYNLKAKYVIHTVGPVYKDGRHNESELLKNCYLNSLRLALMYNIKTIAFPSISTGAYGYPIREAAPIAIQSVIEFLKENNEIEKVIFVLFSKIDFDIYKETLKNYME